MDLPSFACRYCSATVLPDGTTVLNGGRSRRGKPRGPPGSRELQTALKGCDDPLFLDFIRRCLEWDPQTRMKPYAALRHAWLRRRLPRPPPTGTSTGADKGDSVSGSGGGAVRSSASGAGGTSGSRASANGSTKGSNGNGSSAAKMRVGGAVGGAETKLPHIPNAIL